MKEVPQDQIFKLKPLFAQIIVEMNLSERITSDEAIVKYDRATKSGYMKLFTDNVDNAKHCLILTHMPAFIDGGFGCFVNLIYSSPEVRSDLRKVNEMHRIIESYAKENKCENIIGSAWTYRGTPSIESMWRSKGYEEQETVFVKKL